MTGTIVEQVIPWVPTRQWVVSVPVPLRYWMAPSQELTATIHTIIRRTIGQYYVHQAVRHGATRATVQPGSVTFLQRFGGSINLNLQFHSLFLRVSMRTARPRGSSHVFEPEPPTDADIAAVVQKISQRVIRQLRNRGYLEAGMKDVVPTGYDPARRGPRTRPHHGGLGTATHRLWGAGRTAGASHRLGLWRRGGTPDPERPPLCQRQRVFPARQHAYSGASPRPVGATIRYTARGAVSLERLEQDAYGDLIYTFTKPWADGTTGITLSPVELLEKLAALVPLPRVPSSTLWRLLGATEQVAGRHHPDATPAGPGGAGRRHPVTALELGAAAHARLWHRYGTLSRVSAGHAADHCRDDRGQRHPEDPAAPEAGGEIRPPLRRRAKKPLRGTSPGPCVRTVSSGRRTPAPGLCPPSLCPVPVCVHPVVRLLRPPRWRAAGHILGPLGLLSALPKAQPLARMPLTSCEERWAAPQRHSAQRCH